MVLTSLVVLAIFQQGADAQNCTAKILAENGAVTCVEESIVPEFDEQSGEGADIEACFQNFCRSGSTRDFLVRDCKSKGYNSCDGLSYHATYSQDTYEFAGKTVYNNGASREGTKRTSSRFTTTFKNGNKVDSDWTEFHHQIADTASYTWKSSHTGGVSASVSTSVEVELPEIAKVSVDAGFTTHMDWEHGTSSADSSTQTFDLTQHIQEEAHSCTRACVLATEGSATVPYTMTGTFTGKLGRRESWANDDDAFVCCYLRPGGSNDCAVLGHQGAGWACSASAGAAAQGCAGLSTSGTKAIYRTTGTFVANMDFEVDVVTASGPYDTCPDRSVCDNLYV